mgnify:CR=1 FL=1
MSKPLHLVSWEDVQLAALDLAGKIHRTMDTRGGIAAYGVPRGGIPAALAERIFEPFSTTKATGTGMGLAMSRSMIEAHGGRIWFASSGDSGTVFRFTLPTTAHHEAVA